MSALTLDLLHDLMPTAVRPDMLDSGLNEPERTVLWLMVSASLSPIGEPGELLPPMCVSKLMAAALASAGLRGLREAGLVRSRARLVPCRYAYLVNMAVQRTAVG
jgi:hypothetical protein